MTGRIVSINTSAGGVPKSPRFEAIIGPNGLDGDRQRFPFHGGSDRTVVLYSLEVISALQAEGHPIDVGTTGENLTIEGLDWPSVVPGSTLTIGSVRLEITKYCSPCDQIRGSFLGDDFMRISHKHHPGFSRVCARVVADGPVRVGDPVVLDASKSK